MQADISNSVAVMTDLIDDLRTYTRIDKVNDFAPIQIVELLQNVIKMSEYNAKLSASIVLLPPPSNIPLIFCVPSDIQVVFTNILDNAVAQILSRNVKNGRIEVSIENRQGTIAVKFRDNAGGIDKSLMVGNNLFEPFATKRVGGTGLGLHTSFKIVKEHRGNIYARNHKARMGAGAEFVVILPVN
jgi:signal transduction histidine kinase